MKLFVYKGFPTDFLAALTVLPLVDSEIASKKNVLLFDNKVRRALDRSLLNMEDDEEFWITYEEYALLKDRVELAVKDYGLEVVIYINNLYPEYYPIEFDLNEELLEEIRNNLDLETAAEQTIACKNFLSVYNSLESIDGELFASFYNYELEKGLKVTVSPYYPAAFSQDSIDVVDLHVHITNDIPLFLKELMRIKRTQPHCISYSITNGILSERNLSSLRAYCQYNGISICERPMLAEQSVVPEEELIKIAQNDIKIPNFESFRKLRFYKNPDINNDVIEISQAKIISDIIAQAENAYVEPHNYRDIFITASTGAGKSVMFQIPAIYLAKKHKKLTIIIEPVKALMQDQKEQLNARGFHRVEAFNSDLISQAEKEEVLKRVKDGETDLLYLSPETLLSYSMETLIGDREIGLIIVDEAHIVTTWGVGFRPDYWYLGGYINRLRNQIQTKWNKDKKVAHFPICAFTATAVNGGLDDSVSETIISLYMENPIKYIGYDDVVIDEAQDLGNDEIIFFKELCELKDGHCFVFYDKNQVVIYDKTDSHTSVKEAEHQILPWIAQSECRLLLSKNCRNTIEIAKTAYSVIDYDVLQKMNDVSGEQPTILFVEKDPKQKLVDIINYYMQQGYKPDEIAVLTMKTEDKSITSGMKKFHNIQFKRDPAENGVLITTARKFKGLENKVIIITDIDEICFSDSAIKKVFYVACSRATHHLSLLIGGGSEKIASIAAAIPGTGFSGKGKIVLKTKTKPLKI